MSNQRTTELVLSCPACGAVFSARNVKIWNVDGSDQCEDGRFESPTYSMKLQCHSCGLEWFRVEDANSDYGEHEATEDEDAD